MNSIKQITMTLQKYCLSTFKNGNQASLHNEILAFVNYTKLLQPDLNGNEYISGIIFKITTQK